MSLERPHFPDADIDFDDEAKLIRRRAIRGVQLTFKQAKLFEEALQAAMADARAHGLLPTGDSSPTATLAAQTVLNLGALVNHDVLLEMRRQLSGSLDMVSDDVWETATRQAAARNTGT